MSAPAAPIEKPRRPWRRRLVLSLVGLAVLVWALPLGVARTPLLNLVAGQLGARLHGQITVGNASLDWFSPVVLRDVEVHDRAGRRLMAAAEVETKSTLLALALHPNQVGTIQVRRLQLEVAFAGRQTDLEQLFVNDVEAATEVAAGADRPLALPQVRLEIADAGVKITDTDRKLSWDLRALHGTLETHADATRTVQLHLEGGVQDGATTGSLKVNARLQHLGAPAFRAELKGKFAAFPLAIASTVARRFHADTELTGSLDGHCELSAWMRDDVPQFQLGGEMILGRCQVASPLLEERLRLDRVQVPCKLHLDGSRLRFEQAGITCDVGQASLRGELDLDAGLDRPGLELTLDLDLARVAEKLPRTLRLHQDLRLTAGKLHLDGRSTAAADGTRWEGRLDMSDLHGLKGQRPVAWTEPVKVAFQARHVGRGMPLIDHLTCSSRFLRIDGAARPDGFDLQLDADLQQLMQPLSEFIDLGPVRLAGQAHGTLAVRQHTGGFNVDGEARLDRFDLHGITAQAWQEDTVTLKLSAQGMAQNGRQRLDTASAALRFGADTLDVRLLESLPDLARLGGLWEVRAEGDLARWQRRGLAWTGLLADQRLAGNARLQARLRPGAAAVEFPSAAIVVRDLQFLGTTLHVREPELMLETAGCWLPNGALELGATTVRCPTLTLDTTRLRLHPATRTAQGFANVRGDVARLRHWLQATDAAPLSGAVAGRLDLDGRGGLAFELQLDDLTWAPPGQMAWQEPRINLSGQGQYDGDVLQLNRLRGGSQYLAWDAQGQLTHLATTKDLALAGQLAFDLQKLEPHLRPYLGKDGHITGTSARAFSLAGPLSPRPGELHVTALKGEMGLSWQAVHTHGCDVGPAEVRACLQQGWFQLYPIETTINEGKLHLQPNIRLEPGPAELVLLAGPVVDKAKLTPELCAGALGFLVPGLAGVARAEGLISVSLDSGRIPVSAPAAGELQGTLIVHSARVSPGPLANELAILLHGPAEATLPRETRIPFQLSKGRVYHRDLQLVFPDLTVRSSGSVGLDGTLALVLEMPIPPRWLGSGKLSAALANKTIRIPVGGTVDRPRLDQEALRRASADLARELGGSAIRNEVERGLERLLRPRN